MTRKNDHITWPTICVFGDSIAEGSGDDDGRGWVDRLKAGYGSELRDGTQYPNIYNLGVDGDRTRDVLERIEPEAARRNARAIIIAVGINDLPWADGREATPPRELLVQYGLLLGMARGFTAHVLALGPTPVDEAAGNHGVRSSDVTALTNLVRRSTRVAGVQFLDLQQALSTNDLADGLHPNAHGHTKLCQTVRDELERLRWDKL